MFLPKLEGLMGCFLDIVFRFLYILLIFKYLTILIKKLIFLKNAFFL